ncbi:MAG: long-chain-fatty-acid--CoA ligase [Alphaproteobacteria bacterium]|nr:long-chain-fatty-acid--CoA ligase [Alphaproteobacteria bacterium]
MYDFSGLKVLADIPRQQAKLRGNSTAMFFQGRETTYAALDTHTSQVANGLIALGQKPGARIGYMGMNSDIFFEVLLGSFKANNVLVGINWRLAPPEVVYVLNDAGCEVVFVGAEFVPMIEGIKQACPKLKHIVAVDGGHASWPAYAAWRDAQNTKDPHLKIKADDDAIQLYTSGTTGNPKGVQLTNGNYIAFFKAAQDAKWGAFGAGEPNLVAMPNFHVAGTNMGLTTLAQGSFGVIMKTVVPDEVLALIEKFKIKNMFLVPAVILMLTQTPKVKTTDISSVKAMFYGASPIAEETLKTAQSIFKGCGFTQLYGLTETVGAGTALQPEDHKGDLLRSCGKPYPGLDIKVFDANDKEVKTGEVGEIVISGPTLMKGYWNKPDATASAIKTRRSFFGGEKRWFYTGDAGFFDKKGYLFIHDRVKDMIVSGGENIYPAEVENAVMAHPAVADCAVIGVPDDKWGEAVKAIVVLKAGQKATAEDIIAFCRTRIAAYKVPKSVDFVEALPRNPSGKVLRRELREPYWKDKKRRVN